MRRPDFQRDRDDPNLLRANILQRLGDDMSDRGGQDHELGQAVYAFIARCAGVGNLRVDVIFDELDPAAWLDAVVQLADDLFDVVGRKMVEHQALVD